MPSKYCRPVKLWHSTDGCTRFSLDVRDAGSVLVGECSWAITERVCLAPALASLSWSSMWILWQRVFINNGIVTCSFTPWASLEPESSTGSWGHNILILFYRLSPRYLPRGFPDSRAHFRSSGVLVLIAWQCARELWLLSGDKPKW